VQLKKIRLRHRHRRPIRGEIDAENRIDTETQNAGTRGGIEVGTATKTGTAIAAGIGRGGVTAWMAGRRTVANEEEVVVQTMAAIGKRDGGMMTAAAVGVAVAIGIRGGGLTGDVVGVGVEAELKGQGTMRDGEVGAGPGAVTRVLKDEGTGSAHRPCTSIIAD